MKFSKEIKVGIFMVSALVLLYFGFNFLKGIDFFSSQKRYYAFYENVDKLTQSNQIFLNGLAVGRVSDIRIIQGATNKVLVELKIDSEVKLNNETIAMLTSDFLGTKSILLDLGKGQKILQQNDTLQAELDKGMAELLEQAAPVASSLQSTLIKVNNILSNLEKNTAQMDKMFAELAATPRLINGTLTITQQKIGELSDQAKSVSQNLNGALSDLRPTLNNFRTLSDSLKDLRLSGTLQRTEEAMVKLNETLGRFNSGDNTVSKLMTEDSLYVNLNKLVLTMDTLANHFNTHPKHFLAPLGKSSRKIARDHAKESKSN
ncbi:MCE family protein [Chryseotalea sanaruensis]|uniref:MCE family protein n=1 Tax=Chryseotalea sanaruensis TaxID=2482724 RepID=A0A401UBT1_9BACT|nr:MlaD family protein [Chryseotalea sanaruensis]GCC52332.1 MCE family protein [Chryseotalea sanaruensis]